MAMKGVVAWVLGDGSRRYAVVYRGSTTFENLPSTLTKDMTGYTYNITDDFTTDSRFVEGAGKNYTAGTNVAVINTGTDDEPVMKFDAGGSFVDFSEIEREMAEGDAVNRQLLDDTVGWESVNLNKPYKYTYTSGSNYVIDYKGDGYANITTNGQSPSTVINGPSTATALSNGFTYLLPAGTYKAFPSKNINGIGIQVIDADNNEFLSNNSADPFTVSVDTNVFARFQIAKNTTISGTETVGIMICRASYDGSYKPYHASVDEQKYNRSEANILGAKNFLNNNAVSTTLNGGTWTVNSDKSITVSGTPTGTSYVRMSNNKVPKGMHILSGILANVSNVVWESITLIKNSSTIKTYSIESANDYIFDTAGYDYDTLTVTVKRKSNNVAISGTIYPMIRLATDTDPTYQPYAQTNRELTVNKLSYADNGVLGAKNYYNIVNTELTTPNDTSYTKTDTGLYIKTNTNGSYRGVYSSVNLLPKTNYRLTMNITKVSGTLWYRVSGSNNNISFISIYESDHNVVSGKTEVVFYSDNYKYYRLTLCVTYDTSQAGEATFDDIMFKLATDTDPTYQPYAQTNRELTINKADISAIGDDESGRTTASRNYAAGDHFQKNGKFCTCIANTAQGETWTLNTNYVEGTIADMNKFFPAGLSSAVGTISNAFAYQAGNLVSYAFRFSPTDDIAAGTNIATGMKNPFVLYNCMASALFADASYNTYRVLLAYTSGTAYFKVLDAIPAGTNIRGTITYIAQ